MRLLGKIDTAVPLEVGWKDQHSLLELGWIVTTACFMVPTTDSLTDIHLTESYSMLTLTKHFYLSTQLAP